MPIALLLQKVMKTFKTGLNKFSVWNNVVALEELLIARAKSAFLVHWFGERLPLQGLYLRVAIANMDALREQYRRVVAASRNTSTGLNLTEPLMGMAGTLVGTVISPTGAIAAVYGLIRAVWRVSGSVTNVLTRILGMLGAMVGGPIVTGIGAVAGLVLLPLGLIFGILGGPHSGAVTIELYELLGALALLITSATAFMNQLMGPRENIRNPLLRQILSLLDTVADLFAQIIGAFAYIVIRIAPLVLPLAIQGIAFKNLVLAVIDFVVFLVQDLINIPGRYPILQTLTSLLINLATGLTRIIRRSLTRRLTEVFTFWTRLMRKVYNETATAVSHWIVRLQKFINDVIMQHWVIRGIQAAVQQIRTIISIIRPAGTPAAAAPSSSGGAGAGTSSGGSAPSAAGSVLRALVPPVPTLPTLPSVAAVEQRVGLISLPFGAIPEYAEKSTAAFAFSEQAQREIQRLRRAPPSVFTSERERLRREFGAGPVQALEGIRREELQLRNLVFIVVGRIMPPEIRVRMPQLLSMFRAIDENLYLHPAPEEEPSFPVLDLPDNQQLRPVVRRLEIHAAGADAATLNRFKDQLLEAMRTQSYVALAGT